MNSPQPTNCSKPNCHNTPEAQYQQTKPSAHGTYTQAYFACHTHTYTDPQQQAGQHQPTCTLFPCNCLPTLPSPTPLA